MDSFKGKYIWIIGASSGIGAALARDLSKRGANLILSARREDKLKDLQEELDGDHHVYSADVSNHEDLSAVAENIRKNFPKLDSVVFLAAIYAPGRIENMDIQKAHQIVDINLNGAFNTVHAVLPILKAQGHGQIALCGSVSGYRGLPQGQPYSATKAAVISLAESLRAEEMKNGIDVKVINPGFVETPMTGQNDFDMPMMISPDEAAEAIAKGLLKKSFEIHFPKGFTLLVKLLQFLPYWLYFSIAKKIKN